MRLGGNESGREIAMTHEPDGAAVVTREQCPECQLPFWEPHLHPSCTGQGNAHCKDATIARLRAEVLRLKEALVGANQSTARACAERERITRDYGALVQRVGFSTKPEALTVTDVAPLIERLRVLCSDRIISPMHCTAALETISTLEAALARKGTDDR
jgi:hypothetical protein